MTRIPSVAEARLLHERPFAEYARVELRHLQAGTYRRKNLTPLDMEMRLHLQRLDAVALDKGQQSRVERLAAEVSAEIEGLGLPHVYAREIAICFLVDGAKQIQSRRGLAPAEAARLAYAGTEQLGAKAACVAWLPAEASTSRSEIEAYSLAAPYRAEPSIRLHVAGSCS